MRTEINVSDAPAEAGVPPNLDKQMLLRARCVGGSVRLRAHVIAQRARTEDVIPTADLEHGNGNLREIFFDRPLLPVIVVIGMGEPVQVIGRDRRSKLCIRGQLAEIENRIIG